MRYEINEKGKFLYHIKDKQPVNTWDDEVATLYDKKKAKLVCSALNLLHDLDKPEKKSKETLLKIIQKHQ